jgi:hypothetical protein
MLLRGLSSEYSKLNLIANLDSRGQVSLIRGRGGCCIR